MPRHDSKAHWARNRARRGWGVSQHLPAENANGPLRLVGSGEGLQLPDGFEGERIEAGAALRNMQR